MAADHADRVRQAAGERKHIALFSDGTGNSSGKLQKTNVWRLYEALDLGYPTNGKGEVQIAYYDNGVGTSAFRPLAALAGIFGFGLSSNVRELYKFLCRNYDPAAGDRIYAFGFSRGAYTTRLLVSFIVTMGVARYRNERDLELDARDLWREYRRCFHTNNALTDLLVAVSRALLRLVVRVKRTLLGQRRYADAVPLRRPWWGRDWWDFWRRRIEHGCRLDSEGVGPEIEFVGVWDTVAAYGGPFVELVRAVDEWIWPLSMPNYRLSPKVKRARHALAIDDKRDAFQPLLWDETVEDESDRNSASPRLQQVWFAGMHADVGGGYADESLSYVSLWWMIEHAERAGLRLLGEFRARIGALRNIYGPIHDSRGGIGAFYRYQPRYINAWIDYDPPLPDGLHVRRATQIYRDPTIDRGRYRHRGQLAAPIRLHHSVEERLILATDGYGPNNLPPDYRVDRGIAGATAPSVRNAVSVPHVLELGNRIKLRRFWYFVSVAFALLLFTKPFWDALPVLRSLGGRIDARADAQPIESALNAFLPPFAEQWTQALAADPFATAALVAGLLGATAIGVGHERTMVDISRAMWRHRFAAPDTPAPQRPRRHALKRAWHGLFFAARRSDGLQRVLAWIKWRAVPWLLGLGLWLALLYGVLAAVTQLYLVWAEPRPDRCPVEAGGKARMPDAAPIASIVPISAPCSDLGLELAAGQIYRIRVTTLDPGGREGRWTDRCGRDGCNFATPDGWDASSWPVDAAKFFRRVVRAPIFAPIVELRSPRRWPPGADWFLGDDIHMLRPALQRLEVDGPVWEGRLEVPAFNDRVPRRAHFFVNDVVLPVDPGEPAFGACPRRGQGWAAFAIAGRYHNNCGLAKVEIWISGDDAAR